MPRPCAASAFAMLTPHAVAGSQPARALVSPWAGRVSRLRAWRAANSRPAPGAALRPPGDWVTRQRPTTFRVAARAHAGTLETKICILCVARSFTRLTLGGPNQECWDHQGKVGRRTWVRQNYGLPSMAESIQRARDRRKPAPSPTNPVPLLFSSIPGRCMPQRSPLRMTDTDTHGRSSSAWPRQRVIRRCSSPHLTSP